MPIVKLQKGIKACYFRIKFKDIFFMKGLFEDMKEYLLEHDWSSVDMNGEIEHKEHWETMYLERGLPNGSVERWIYWRLQKYPVQNSYYRWHLDIDWHNVALSETEVMRDGKKLKVNKGEVEVKVWTYLELDYKGEWSKHPILKIFSAIFPNRIMKEDFEDHKRELYREAYNLGAYIKRWMKLKRFLPYEEIALFHPSKAYPEWKKE